MSQAQTIEDYPRVIDGDTLDIQGQRIRIANIDAPESKQTCSLNGSAYYCGKTSTQFLRSFIGGSKATCKVISKDRYKRFISTCYVRETDIGAVMVAGDTLWPSYATLVPISPYKTLLSANNAVSGPQSS